MVKPDGHVVEEVCPAVVDRHDHDLSCRIFRAFHVTQVGFMAFAYQPARDEVEDNCFVLIVNDRLVVEPCVFGFGADHVVPAWFVLVIHVLVIVVFLDDSDIR